jgi:hypothetical protein
MLAVVSNLRFQALREISISVIATLLVSIGNTTTPHQLLKENVTFDSPIDPQRCLSHPFTLRAPVQGSLDLTATAHFKFENLPNSVAVSEKITIIPSQHIPGITRSTSHNFLQVSVQNLFPSRMTNVRCRTPAGEGGLLASSLENQEHASVFFEMARGATDQNSIELSWSLPFALKCVQKFLIKEKPSDAKQNPIGVILEGVPQTAPALQQIDVVAKIRNATEEVLQGEITIVKDNQVLLSVGKIDLRFEGLQPGEERAIPLSFISLYQGYFQFPAFKFELAGGRSFVSEPRTGLLVVGYTDAGG